MSKAKGPVQVKTGTEAVEVSAKSYEVVGLQHLDNMPLQLGGQTYDLAALSDEDAKYLAERTPWVRLLS
jgi:hypothetical protein